MLLVNVLDLFEEAAFSDKTLFLYIKFVKLKKIKSPLLSQINELGKMLII